jgi:hypothetical protein
LGWRQSTKTCTHSLIVAELAKDPKRAGEPLQLEPALLLGIIESGRSRKVHALCSDLDVSWIKVGRGLGDGRRRSGGGIRKSDGRHLENRREREEGRVV